MRILNAIGLCLLLSACGITPEQLAQWNEGCPHGRNAFGMCNSGGGYYGNYDGWIKNRAAHHRRVIESKYK